MKRSSSSIQGSCDDVLVQQRPDTSTHDRSSAGDSSHIMSDQSMLTINHLNHHTPLAINGALSLALSPSLNFNILF